MVDAAKKIKDKFGNDENKVMKKLGLLRVKDRKALCDEVNGANVVEELGLGDSEPVEVDDGQTADLQGDLSPEQGRCIIKKVLDEVKPEDFTAEDVSKFAEVLGGIATKHINQLNPDERLSISREMCSSVPGLKPKQLKAIVNQYITGLIELTLSDGENYMENMDLNDVTSLGPRCLLQLKPEEIAATDTDVCQAICQSIGNSDLSIAVFNERGCAKLAAVCLECLGKDSSSEELTEVDTATLGPGLAGCLENIDRLNSSADTLGNIGGACLTENQRKVIGSKIKEAIRTSDDAQEVGALVGTDDAIVVKCRTILRDAFSDGTTNSEVSQELQPEEGTTAEEAQGRCQNSETTADRVSREEMEDRMNECIKEAVAASQDETVRRRKRRETKSYTCDALSTMESAVTALTVAELEAVSSTEFTNCVAFFGAVKGWSDDQIAALLEKIKTDLASGDLCNLEADVISILGEVATGLTKENIDCMKNLDTSGIAELGKISTWSTEQREAFADKYMSKNPLTSGSDLTKEHAVNLGHFICGLTPEEIGKIPIATYQSSVGIIGSLKSCPREHLVKFAGLAKHPDVYGASVSDWTDDKYQELGIALGGLSGEELSKASVDSMEGWTPQGIANIHPDDFEVLSVQQLESLGSDQAQAITSSQLAKLSTDKKNAVYLVRDGDEADLVKDSKETSRAGVVASVSFAVLIFSVVATVF